MRRRLWKAYFFLALALTFLGLALPVFVGEDPKMAWWEWVYMPLYVVQIVGLFGFVFWRRLAVPPVWQFVFIASVAYEAWNLVSTATNPELEGTGYTGLALMTVGATLVLQAPMFIGLFLYGFRCRELWHGAT
jgi:hypothetical protein